jgi:glycosyltransferase involved in cell wall biosynthesis
MKSILYITRMNFFLRKAHIFNTVKTCVALARLPDVAVTTISTNPIPSFDQTLREAGSDPKVSTEWKLISIPSLGRSLAQSSFFVWRWIGLIADNIAIIRYIIRNKNQFDTIYFRDHFLFLTVWFNKYLLRKPIFFESHYLLKKWLAQRMVEYCIRAASGVITIAFALEKPYHALNKHITTIFCAAAEPEVFDSVTEGKEVLRSRLNLPQKTKIIGYIGNIERTGDNDSYGVEDIVAAMPHLPDWTFVAVGKKNPDNKELEHLAASLGVSDRVVVLPWIARTEVASYLRVFDILAIPAAGARPGNAPTKIFEYLVSGRPIVAANTGPIAEVLHDRENALLVNYQDPTDWARAVCSLSENQTATDAMIKRAYADGLNYTWESRAKRIVSFITSYETDKKND